MNNYWANDPAQARRAKGARIHRRGRTGVALQRAGSATLSWYSCAIHCDGLHGVELPSKPKYGEGTQAGGEATAPQAPPNAQDESENYEEKKQQQLHYNPKNHEQVCAKLDTALRLE